MAKLALRAGVVCKRQTFANGEVTAEGIFGSIRAGALPFTIPLGCVFVLDGPPGKHDVTVRVINLDANAVGVRVEGSVYVNDGSTGAVFGMSIPGVALPRLGSYAVQLVAAGEAEPFASIPFKIVG